MATLNSGGYAMRYREAQGQVRRRAIVLAVVCVCSVQWGWLAASAAQEPPLVAEAVPLRGLLASPPFAGQPLKSVYFFPGEGGAYNQALYTVHPSADADLHWNSDRATRAPVIDRMIAAHANTLVMSYWGDEMQMWSPMAIDETSLPGVIAAVRGKAIVVIPALESGFNPNDPSQPHWRFAEDFPYVAVPDAPRQLAPGLQARLRALVALFKDDMSAWAELYDREGRPRHVVHIIDAFARFVPEEYGKRPSDVVAGAFEALAREFSETEGIDIGFTLDVTAGEWGSFAFEPTSYGASFEAARAVLGIQWFMSESRSGRVLSSLPGQAPIDNNTLNLNNLLAGKLALIDSWIATGVPVIYDVSPGFDGRYVWQDIGSGFWGDNSDYTSDAWRNLQSEQKGRGVTGISFSTWNGYTEGYAAVPTLEHGTVIYDWLTDVFAPDPRECDHTAYRNGEPSLRVSGAICELWQAWGASQGWLGAPVNVESGSRRGRVVHFEHASIFVSEETGAHEVHGAILEEYERL
ncbi:MAG: hypothetical protein RL701_7847, partial [Pseudomonadota bacterium]